MEKKHSFARGSSLVGSAAFEALSTVQDDNFPQLTKDIVFEVLTHLSRGERRPCTLVSKMWNLVSSDQFFGWHPVVSMRYHPRFASYETPQRDYKKITEYLQYKILDVIEVDGYTIKLKDGTTVTFNGRYPLTEFVNVCTENPKLWRYDILQKQNDVEYYLIMELNVRTLEKLVAEDKPVVYSGYIFDAVAIANENFWQKQLLFGKEPSHKKSITPQMQPPGLNSKIKMHQYQLAALGWMKGAEDLQEFNYTKLIPWRTTQCDVLFDPKNKKMVSCADIQKYVTQLKPKGAVLADEMGLGKTMEILSLILSNPGTEEIDAKFHKKLSEDDADKLKLDELLFKTNATLVICPGHLLQQWYGEIMKHTVPQLNTIALTTIADLKNICYADIAYADVVIVSLQLLKNNSYKYLSGSSRSKVTGTAVERQLKILRSSKDKGGFESDSPLMHHFLWHRLVIDEGHEVVLNSKILEDLETKHKWFVSGTPMPNANVYSALLSFLGFPDTPYPLFAFMDYIANNLYWRNTKKSIQDEDAVPPLVQDLVMIDHHPIETAIYANLVSDCRRLPYRSEKEFLLRPARFTLSQLKTQFLQVSNECIKARSSIWKSEENTRKEIAQHTKMIKDLADLKTYDDNTDFKPYLENMFEQPVEKEEEDKIIENDERQSEISTKNEVRKLLMDINSYSVPTLKKELTERNIPFKNSAKKAELVALLKEAIKNKSEKNSENSAKNSDENSDAEEKSETTQKRGRGAKKAKKEAGDQKEEEQMPKRGRGEKKAEKEQEKKGEAKKGEKEEERSEKEVEISRKRGRGAKKEPDEEKASQKKAKVDDSAVNTNRANQVARMQDKMMEQKLLQYLIEKYGSKIAHLILYLRKAWKQNPNKRFIIFTQRSPHTLAGVLSEFNIDVDEVEGTVVKRTKAINNFKGKNSTVRVLVMGFSTTASGANLIESDHVILLDPLFGKTKLDAEATEQQAIARAHRQGQAGQVTVTRFIIRNTLEQIIYLQHHEEELPESNESVSTLQRGFSIVRTNSVETIIANAPALQKAGSMAELLGSTTPISTVDIQPPIQENLENQEKEQVESDSNKN